MRVAVSSTEFSLAPRPTLMSIHKGLGTASLGMRLRILTSIIKVRLRDRE